MKKMLTLLLSLALTGSIASAATQLNLRVEANGSSDITVAPGEKVDYQVIGWLQDTDNNQGLALFAFDLAYDCGDLEQASAPDPAVTPGIENFQIPLGITNPAGFGGTPDVPGREGDLVQIGGAWNTINNVDTFAPYPIGTEPVIGFGHIEVVLAEGSLTIPADATDGQVCHLVASNVIANTVLNGEVDDGTHWAVEAASEGTLQQLTMTVEACASVASANPACDSLLPRIQSNIVRINFSGPIPDPLPGDIEIRVLEDGGVLGADVTADWTCEVEGGTTLKCINTGTPAANETWYGIIGTGGCPYDFALHYGVVYGDANGDTRTNAFDVNDIWANRTDSAPDDSPYDVNGDGRINAFDVNDAWVNRNSEDPGKPTGHVCVP